jgi:hypothetical protein
MGEGQRLPPEVLAKELETYMNKLISFSPLICNSFYLRDFLTMGTPEDEVGP